MNEEEKYNEIRKKLRSLPRIRAGKGFETRLFQRVQHELRHGVPRHTGKKRWLEGRTGWIFNLLRHPVLTPAAALTSVVIIGLVVYLTFFTQNPQPESMSQQTPTGPKEEYSISKLETLKSKISNLKTEEKEIAKRDESPEPPPTTRRYYEDKRSDYDSKSLGRTTEGYIETEQQPREKLAAPEKEEDFEKKEAPSMDKSKDDDEGNVIDGVMKKGFVPTEENEKKVEEKSETHDTTKAKDVDKKKKSKKKGKKSEIFQQNPPVEQKVIRDTITRQN